MEGIHYDEFGPEKVLHVYNPKVGMRGFVVIDNTTFGPGKGGCRMTASVSVREVSRLARAMTWKCSMAELPFGGAKSGIVADDRKMSAEKKAEIVHAFAEEIKALCPDYYVTAPDMNMAEKEMRILAKVCGNDAVTGKPRDLGGLPHELGSTGFGVFHATKVALAHLGKDVNEITFAVEGFGNVGQFAAKFLSEAGAKLVAVSDSQGCASMEKGFDVEKLLAVKQSEGKVTKYPGIQRGYCEDILSHEADVLVTAAVPDLVTGSNVDKVKAKLVVEGSNIPMTPSIEELLHQKGILVIPDFVANAGGVISSYVEWKKGPEQEMWKTVEEKITRNTKIMLDAAREGKTFPRAAAMKIAKDRVLKECRICRT